MEIEMTTKKTAAATAAEQMEAAVTAGKGQHGDRRQGHYRSRGQRLRAGRPNHQRARRSRLQGRFRPFKGYEDVTAFNKDNVDALVKSGAVLAKGAQTSTACGSISPRRRSRTTSPPTKALLWCKTLQQVAEVQGDLVKNTTTSW